MNYKFLFSNKKHNLFGVNFSYKIDLLKLDRLARKMIDNCDRWKANWLKVREEISPEIQERLKRDFECACRGFSEQEIQMLLDKLKTLKE